MGYIMAIDSVEQSRPLLDKAAQQAVQHLPDLKPAQLVLMTQGMFPLGENHPAMREVLDYWTSLLSEGEARVPSEGGGSLAQLLGGAPQSKRKKDAELRDAFSADKL